MTTCGIHNTPVIVGRASCSSCAPRLPFWHELMAIEKVLGGQMADLRIDTGDFRIWTSRMDLDDGEPFEKTVYVEVNDDGWWKDLGHYDGDEPPRSLPGVTHHAFRGHLKADPDEQAWKIQATDIFGMESIEGEFLIEISADSKVSAEEVRIAWRGASWRTWGPPSEAKREH